MPRGFQYMADLSSNNGPVNIPGYSRAGHSCIAIKATEGDNYVNPYHLDQCNQSHNFGLTVVHYHYWHPGNVQNQINHFREIYRTAWRNGDYICFDMEVNGITANEANKVLINVYSQTGHEPVLYCSEEYLRNVLFGMSFPGRRVWIAKYGTFPRYDRTRYKLWAWQYTDGTEGPEPHYYTGIGKCDGSIISFGPALACQVRKIRTRKAK